MKAATAQSPPEAPLWLWYQYLPRIRLLRASEAIKRLLAISPLDETAPGATVFSIQYSVFSIQYYFDIQARNPLKYRTVPECAG
ncbi:hypothetical protein QNH14_03405 [Apirhabdus apintestini]|nr:hypothetical protein QNH14_03405 [Enterobacteriaceae bacterium CA-0114]